MKTLTLCFVLVTLLEFATLGLAAIVHWEPCANPDGSMTVHCTVHNVDIRPCKEAASGKPCRIRRGRTAGVSLDFTPDFSGDNLETRAYTAIEGVDAAFVGMNTNACEWTTCPVTAGTRQTYNYTLPIGTSLPQGPFEVKWKLWNAENKGCCFLFRIALV